MLGRPISFIFYLGLQIQVFILNTIIGTVPGIQLKFVLQFLNKALMYKIS